MCLTFVQVKQMNCQKSNNECQMLNVSIDEGRKTFKNSKQIRQKRRVDFLLNPVTEYADSDILLTTFFFNISQ